GGHPVRAAAIGLGRARRGARRGEGADRGVARDRQHGDVPCGPDVVRRLRLERLHDPSGAVGEARLDAQYLRANVDPSELYVLSLPGTTKLRMAADGSGYRNLVLAGDWTRTSWNVGCIEAAAESGVNAAAAVARFSPARRETPPG